jgi:hypothetical protein
MTCSDLSWGGEKPEGVHGMAAQDEPGRSASGQLCRCGHGRAAHSHYRGGSDCALCTCPRFRMDWRALLFRRPRR